MAAVQILCAHPCGNGCAWKTPQRRSPETPRKTSPLAAAGGRPRYAEVLAAGTLELPEERESLR